MKKRTNFTSAIRKMNRTRLYIKKFIIQKIFYTNGSQKNTIIVAGVQRSGTNMLMGILERSMQTTVFHERDSRTYHEFQMKPIAVIKQHINNSTSPVVVIKSLCELQDIPKFLDVFSPAKCLWVNRRYENVVNSHIERWTKMKSFIEQIIANKDKQQDWRGKGMSEETFNLINNLYSKNMNNATACALFWYFRTILFFEKGLDKDSRVLMLNYEDMLSDPDQVIPNALKSSGVTYKPAMTSIIFKNTPTRPPELNIDKPVRDICDKLTQRINEHIENCARE